MNTVFFVIVAMAVAVAGYRQLGFDPSAGGEAPMAALSKAMITSAGDAVTLAIGLVGAMALFLGLMKVAEAGGLLTIVARLIRPVMVRLFPEIPPDHPAMGAMVLNLSANALGLGNAATPFGIRAMQALETLNPRPGTATNAMVLFLAINTSSITLLPTGVIAIRAAANAADPAAVLPTTLLATFGSTLAAVAAAFYYRKWFPVPEADDGEPAQPGGENRQTNPTDDIETDAGLLSEDQEPFPLKVSITVMACLASLVPMALVYGKDVSPWILPGLMMAFLLFGVIRRVPVYEQFVAGATDGFQVALRIIPYLVAILVAVGMLRASGALDVIVRMLGQITGPLGLPAEALPMALIRPLSGSGAYGVLAATLSDPNIGPDGYVGLLVSTLQGSTETTFYVMAIYFGAVGIRRMRHALPAALTADLAGIVFAVIACRLLLS